MSHSTTKAPKEDRLSIRANASQKAVLTRAAQAQRMNVSQFVLQASVSEAERVLQEAAQLWVSPEEYERLSQIMDEAPSPVVRLREALTQKPVWDE